MSSAANSAGSPLPPLGEEEIACRVATERARLEQAAGLAGKPVEHFHRPRERPFNAEERDRVTILFGGFTWKHERLIEAVFRGCGYRFQMLPNPNLAAFQTGKEYGNNGQCNPTYFTVGNLIEFLRSLEAQGLSRQEIIDNYIFFTAGSCGPCRFGMYESEYRMAMENAGFGGFRILLFQQDQGVKANSGQPGLKFSADLFMGELNAVNLGDVINDMVYQIRPYEIARGTTDQAIKDVVDQLSDFLEHRKRYEILERTPRWFSERLSRRKKLKDTSNTLGKILTHLYSKDFLAAMRLARERLGKVEVDHTRVKPIVKITGEFWAQLTEGDGNFNMFTFLEQEGAQVYVEPIGAWVTYLLYEARANLDERKGLDVPYPGARWWQLKKQLANQWKFRKKWLLLRLSEGMWNRQHARAARHLGGLTHRLAPQGELARMAHPFYHSLARGGEGHLEVGKNVYYTTHGLCHMVLALKPFGCMPSSQSDGVQSAVVNRFPEMIFLPIETSGEGEINAHSRMQMALGEAKIKAKAEFEQALASTGKKLDEIKAYVAKHRQLRSPFYPVPRRQGIAGVAANFVLHVSNLIDGKAHLAKLPGEA
ncbi:MAG: activator of (R)-2-hydroxyglutaryl-CoA dehydratase [Acidobacteriia bacterium]|nr:activator of (R)-2-hydroxyglutaryl-CoA dehydratase [Terriglobia bacterium]